MSKATGSWESLIKGVSEQVAHQRFPGQHWEQVNMVSDPVRGLARRQGSRMLSEKLSAGITNYSAATRADARMFGEQSLYLGVSEYSVMHRKLPRPAGSSMTPLVVINKATGAQLNVRQSPTDDLMTRVFINGISSVASVGKLVLLAANNQDTTYDMYDTVSTAGDPFANRAVAWIKGGSYSRTYTVAVKAQNAQTGQIFTVQYTTPASYFPGTLDTSDIPATITDPADPAKTIPNPNYQKLVNDRVYAYQKDVNQWISTAQAAIQPQAIAQRLAQAIVAHVTANPGIGVGVLLQGSHILLSGVVSCSADDGGDGSQVTAVARVVKQVSDLSTIHTPNKVVKVQPQSNSAKSYYVQAVPKNPGNSSDWQEVNWEEAAGLRVTPKFVTAVACVIGEDFFVASTPAILQSISGAIVPGWEVSASGDLESQTLPAFLGRPITYIRMFQDRLVVVAGATVFMSRSGDYFNFFRKSALTLDDSDPIEIYALGSEDDVINSGTLLDRNLILFGRQWQYAISGRDSITPTSAFVAVQSGYKDSNDCPPETSGNLIFFTQQRSGKLTVQQMQTGAYADTLTAYEITKQLNSYLQGRPQQIVAVTSPSALFVRTDLYDNSFWVYSYLDANGGDERLFDSWSRWQFDEALGTMISMCSKDGDLLVTTLRVGNGGQYIAVDRFTMSTDLTDSYTDSRRPLSLGGVLQGAGFPGRARTTGVYNRASGRYWLIGDVWANLVELRQEIGGSQDFNMDYGMPFESYVVLTNPYHRDRDGNVILESRLTLSNLNVTVYQTAALRAGVEDMVTNTVASEEVVSWTARSANGWILNTQQVAGTASIVVGVYKEIRDAKVTLASRSWLPLTISSIEWAGQLFTRR